MRFTGDDATIRQVEKSQSRQAVCSGFLCLQAHVSNLHVDRLSLRAPAKAHYMLAKISISRRIHLTLGIMTSVVLET